MILSLLLTASLLSATIRPIPGADAVVVIVGCEGGWERASLMELEDTKSFRYATRGEFRGKCVMEVKAINRKGEILKVDRKMFMGNEPFLDE